MMGFENAATHLIETGRLDGEESAEAIEGVGSRR